MGVYLGVIKSLYPPYINVIASHLQLINSKPKEKQYKLFIGNGLYLLVMPNGSKYWRFKYRYADKDKAMAIGVFPDVSIKEAREIVIEAKKQLKDNKDPAIIKKTRKLDAHIKSGNTFRVVAESWYENMHEKWTPKHAHKTWRRLEIHVFPYIGDLPIAEIEPLMVLDTIKKIEKLGHTETSHRVLRLCSDIFHHGIINRKLIHNPAFKLSGALKSHVAKHMPALPMHEIPEMLARLEAHNTNLINKLAIKLLMLTMVRPTELRKAEWSEINFKEKLWRIPSHRMKNRIEHTVPLSKQSLEILSEAKKITGNSPYIFAMPERRKNPYISENTIKNIMGVQSAMLPHGSMQVIEKQLAAIIVLCLFQLPSTPLKRSCYNFFQTSIKSFYLLIRVCRFDTKY